MVTLQIQPRIKEARKYFENSVVYEKYTKQTYTRFYFKPEDNVL